MKIIKFVGRILYALIIFIIIIYGIVGIGKVLEFIGITGSFNSSLQYLLAVYGLGMFFYDIDKAYKDKNKSNH